MSRSNKYSQDIFIPKNPQKYIGNHTPFYRSSWEKKVMYWMDEHPNIIAWSSESIAIQYFNPEKLKMTVYFPDFFMTYEDQLGNQFSEVIEVKPKDQTVLKQGLKGKAHHKQNTILQVNYAKWHAAQEWCNMRNFKFRVITENDIFGSGDTIKLMNNAFNPINVEKYIGNIPIYYHGNTEIYLMKYFDEHPNIISWALADQIHISYDDPDIGIKTFTPDYIIKYKNINNELVVELVFIIEGSTWLDEVNGGKEHYDIIKKLRNDSIEKYCHEHSIKYKLVNPKDIYNVKPS